MRMLQFAGIGLLAQMNTTVGGAGSAPAAERTGGAVTGGAGGPTTGQGAVAVETAPGSQPGNAGPNPRDQAPSFGWQTLLPIILMFGVLYLFLFRGQRKDEKKRKAMIATLKKGDRVMTIGGMLASVVSVEGDEVVLKVDESANVKARYRKSSIQEVIDRDDKK
jgi:preprotein translocase subunit YajC